MPSCGPQNQTGPFSQTLFLGCSITSLSVSGGLNEQVTSVTVNLVEDSCPASEDSPKLYYDADLQPQYTTDPDPGFIGEIVPIVGCPVYLRLGDFEFGGIVQSYEYMESDGGKTYSVKLAVPLEILQGTQLIINDYSGAIKVNPVYFPVFNTFNLFGFYESLGVPTPTLSLAESGIEYRQGDYGPDGATFGSQAGGFGGARTNDNGMRWRILKDSVNILINGTPKVVNNFSPYGRVVYNGISLAAYGAPYTNGYGLLNFDIINSGRYLTEYMVDISELPTNIPDDYRFSGTTVTLLDVISTICGDAGFDYYLELMYVNTGIDILKVLKVRPISRTGVPIVGQVAEFINSAKSSGVYNSSTLGLELRNEVTASMLIGANKQTIYQAYENVDTSAEEIPAGQPDNVTDLILPYFGTEPMRSNEDAGYQSYIVPIKDADTPFGPDWAIMPDPTIINNSLSLLAFEEAPLISLTEMLFAQVGYDAWYSKLRINPDFPTDTGILIDSHEETMASFLEPKKVVKNYRRGKKSSPRDAFNVNPFILGDLASATNKKVQEDLQKIHMWVSAFAEFIGRDFMVRVPYTSFKVDEDTQVFTYSETPTNDGGWTDQTNILGIDNPSFPIDFLSDESGKILSFVRMKGNPDEIDIAHMNPDSFVIYGDSVYVKANVDEKFVFLNRNYEIPRVVVSLSDEVVFKDAYEQAEHDALAGVKRGIQLIQPDFNDEAWQTISDQIGARSLNEPSFKYPINIEAAAIPMRSNVLTYGPWADNGPAGQTRIEKDDGLAPWEFGGYGPMNIAGQALASAGVSNQQYGETGQVTLAGYPTLPMGAEINGLAAGLINNNLVENRSATLLPIYGTSYNGTPFVYLYYAILCGTWIGAAGPNITGLTVQFDTGGIMTTYQLRTFTPSFGRFAKLNAERLKQAGKNRIKFERKLRLRNQFASFSKNKTAGAKNSILSNRWKDVSRVLTPSTPHEVFVGQIVDWDNNSKRTLVACESLGDLVNEINGGYKNKAVMSLDGLLRPVSMDGSGGLPRYVSPGGSYFQSSKGAIGPIYDETGDEDIFYGGTGSGNRIDIDYLNPFSSPTGNRGKVVEHRSEGSGGHDIDMVAYSGGTGTFEAPDSMILRGTGDYTYPRDCRMLALRGPILMQSWGYDTDGKPVPNAADTTGNMQSGIFATGNLQDKFFDNWLQKPETWVVAPIDLRLDRERGLWVSPPKKDHLAVEINETITANGSGFANILIPEGLEDAYKFYKGSGEEIDSPRIMLHEVIGGEYSAGDKVVAGYHERNKRWEIIAAQGGGGSVDIKIVLIDADISGSIEEDPTNFLTSSEIDLGENVGYQVRFQDPKDDDLTANLSTDPLNLWQYKRERVDLKYYNTIDITGIPPQSGTVSGIKLASSASTENNFYNNDVITITSGPGNGETKNITAYVGSTKTATVDSAWSTIPTTGSVYKIASQSNLALAYEVITDDDNNLKIVRYDTMSVWYDDGKPFYVGTYAKSDFPDYPENKKFPGSIPDEKLKRRFRGVTMNNILITALCKPLPPVDVSEYYT